MDSAISRLSWVTSIARRVVPGALAIALSFLTHPAWAGDPFRTDNPHEIDAQTEQIFRAMFEQGDYVRAARLLENANESEPMIHAIRASLAYMDQDWAALGTSATQTRETAEQLVATDPLRGNLYIAVGHFMEGAHALMTQGTVRGTPVALQKLQLVFSSMDAAEAIDPNDPELNLIQGFMDLMLAVNLPFANPQDAINRLDTYAAPDYLAQRGIAIAYRDLNQQDLALAAVDEALEATPDNPDLLYLRAQILVQQDNDTESVEWFNRALSHYRNLPQSMSRQIYWEMCRARNRSDGSNRNCEVRWEEFLEASGSPRSERP